MLTKNALPDFSAPLYGLYTYEVTYCINFPTGPGVVCVLHYQARDAAHAVRQLNCEMLRSSPLGFTWFLLTSLPLGVVND